VYANEIDARSATTDRLNGVVTIRSDVDDLGQAINSAIGNLAPGGGKIQLPRGRIPMETTVDLSRGVNGQTQATPIVIEGQGRTAVDREDNNAGTFIDAANVDGHAFYLGAIDDSPNYRESVTLREFTIANMPEGSDGIHFGDGPGWARTCVLENLTIRNGGGYGVWSNTGYGARIENVYVWNCARGYYFHQGHSQWIANIVARGLNDPTGWALDVNRAAGLWANGIYLEGNDGGAFRLSGRNNACTFENIYCEHNGKEDQMDTEVYLGAPMSDDMPEPSVSGVTSNSTVEAVTFGGLHDGQSFGERRFQVQLFEQSEIKGAWQGGSEATTDLYASGTGARGENIYKCCTLENVAASESAKPSMWMQNRFTGSVDRHADAVVPIGQ
jgi:hypothetical protein